MEGNSFRRISSHCSYNYLYQAITVRTINIFVLVEKEFFYMVGYDVRATDLTLSLFLTTKTALYAQCLCLLACDICILATYCNNKYSVCHVWMYQLF